VSLFGTISQDLMNFVLKLQTKSLINAKVLKLFLYKNEWGNPSYFGLNVFPFKKILMSLEVVGTFVLDSYEYKKA